MCMAAFGLLRLHIPAISGNGAVAFNVAPLHGVAGDGLTGGAMGDG